MIKYSRRKGKPLANYGLYQAKASGDAKAYSEIERVWFEYWGIVAFSVSPMVQFDESHKRWIENGRGC